MAGDPAGGKRGRSPNRSYRHAYSGLTGRAAGSVPLVDLPYLPTFIKHQRIRETPVSGGSICQAARLTLDDGNSIFTKSWPAGPPPTGFFEAEAAGLDWLR